MGRKNNRNLRAYCRRFGFDPRKYIGLPRRSAYDGYAAVKSYAAAKPYSADDRHTAADEQHFVPAYRDDYRMPHRGEIWFADLGLDSGTSVQIGCRPVFVISNDIGNRHAQTIAVLPMTTRLKRYEMPTHVILRQEDLAAIVPTQSLKPSMVLAEQITTISKEALRTYLGAVGEGEKMNEIDNAVKTQLALLTAQSFAPHYDEGRNGIS